MKIWLIHLVRNIPCCLCFIIYHTNIERAFSTAISNFGFQNVERACQFSSFFIQVIVCIIRFFSMTLLILLFPQFLSYSEVLNSLLICPTVFTFPSFLLFRFILFCPPVLYIPNYRKENLEFYASILMKANTTLIKQTRATGIVGF